jgi:hypothetical protein
MLKASLHQRFDAIPGADWDRCLPHEAECHAYYAACQTGETDAPVAVSVSDGERIIAVAPLFTLSYRLDTSLQGPLRRLTEVIAARFPGFLRLDLIGLGSALAERCHLGFDPAISAEARQAALGTLLSAIETYAQQSRIGLVVIKDIAGAEAVTAAPILAARGFARVSSLPVAVLDVPENEEEWFARLSSGTRKDIRRKLKGAGHVGIEAVTDISALADEIAALYEETRAQSRFDYDEFEELPPGYFAAISKALGERAVFMLYRIDGQLAAFNLLLVEEDRVIDKFLGMRYPLGRDNDLYAVSWVANLRFAIARGKSLLQTGQTAYAAKLRFGSRLVPSDLWFRHRNPLINGLLRLVAPLLAFDRNDPDLKALAAKGKAA